MRKDHIKPKDRLQFEVKTSMTDWFELVKVFLFGALFIGLIGLCFAPFMWR